MTYQLKSLYFLSVAGLLIGLSSTPAAADTIVNINQGKGATVESCKKGPPVTWVNSDGTTGTDKYKNYRCINGVMSPNIPTISADTVELALGLDSLDDGQTVTFDEALQQCRAERSDDLQACIDKRTGQRRADDVSMNKLGDPVKAKCIGRLTPGPNTTIASGTATNAECLAEKATK